LVKMMRDLRKQNPKLFSRVTSLPDRVRSARAAERDELIVFCRAGDYSALYMADDEGTVISRDQMEILKALKCDPKTPRVSLPKAFNAHVRRIEAEFQEDAQERAMQQAAVSAEPLVRQTLKLLNTLARKVKGEDRKTITELRDRLTKQPLSPKEKRVLRSLRQRVESPAEQVRFMHDLLLGQQTLGFDAPVKKPIEIEPVVVQVIASEALVSDE